MPVYCKPVRHGSPGRIRMSQQAFHGLEAQWKDAETERTEPVRGGFKYISVLATTHNISVARRNELINDLEAREALSDLVRQA